MTAYIAPPGSDPFDDDNWQPLGEVGDIEVMTYGANINHLRTRVEPVEMKVDLTQSPFLREVVQQQFVDFHAIVELTADEALSCPACGNTVWNGFVTAENQIELWCPHPDKDRP